MKLYEITEQYQSALSELAGLELDEETVNDTLEGLKGDLEAKGRAVGAFIANREAEIEATKEAGKKLIDRAKSEQNKMDKLKDYLKYNMEVNGLPEIRSPDLLIKLRKLPASVIIDDAALIPIDFKREKVDISLDKTAIKEYINNIGTIKGVHLESGYKVVIT